MKSRQAARTQQTIPSKHSRSASKVINPGKLVIPELSLLRKQAETLSPVYGISRLLCEAIEAHPARYAAASVRPAPKHVEAEPAPDTDLLLEQARLTAPVHEISALLAEQE